MKIVSVVGARPQFIKAAALSPMLRLKHREILIHTGQHYDSSMSEIFFEDLRIPHPEYSLHIGSGSHGHQTGKMLAEIESVLTSEKPDLTLIYGDTNSTLAGALASAKLHIPVAHVEAGLRSFNKRMPEEINRIVADHLSAILLAPTQTAVENLAREGIDKGVSLVGDIMYDVLVSTSQRIKKPSPGLRHATKGMGKYFLLTVHRAENTDDPQRFSSILRAVTRIAKETPVVFPAHPRLQPLIEVNGIGRIPGIVLLPPVTYTDMVYLEKNASLILTDSGGVQKEAYWLGIPCITLRDQTEWVETVASGWNRLAGTDENVIFEAAADISKPVTSHKACPAAAAICHVIDRYWDTQSSPIKTAVR